MDFKSYLQTSAEEINQELEIFFKSWVEEVKSVSLKLIDLNRAYIEASDGGKRLRGTLVKLGYELTGKTDNQEILKPAAAFEIFQTAILAHDDIIDQSPLRRGKPTLYHVLGGNQYGISQTICLGDIGYFLAVRLLAQSNFPLEEKNKALKLFAQGMLETALGQMLDIELPYRDGPKEENDALTIFRLKTARYTIVGPMSLGVILGDGDENLLKNIEIFGDNLGIAFQIQDDILGIFGDEKTIGKSVTSDAEEGKLTLLYLHALKNASKEQRWVLDKYYGKGLPAGRQGKIGEEELGQIREVFKDTGALEYASKEALRRVNLAKVVISALTRDPEKISLLSGMADFLVQRKS